MKGRTAKERKRIGNAYIATVSVLLVLIAVAVFRSGILPLRSIEVAFSDIAPDGLAIVPASCASPAPPYSQMSTVKSGEYLGYKIPPGTHQADIYISNISTEFCITNTSSFTYFLPLNSAAEANAFISALSSLSGLSKKAP
jgi:hypothetical protein